MWCFSAMFIYNSRHVFPALIIITLHILDYVHSAKFLMITAGDAGSHFLVTRRVGEALAQKGHAVTFVSGEREARLLDLSLDNTKLNFSIIRYPDKVSQDKYDDLFRAIGETVFENPAGVNLVSGKVGAKMVDVTKKWGESILGNTDAMERVRNESFDLAFFESVTPWCGYVAKAVDVPFVTMSTLTTTPNKAWENRADVSPAYYPAYSSGYDQRMDFRHRFQNTLFYMFVFLLRHSFFRTIEPANPPSGLSTPDLLGEAQIWFVRTHFTLDFARSLPANAIPVGGVLTQPAKPLEKNIEAFLQGSEENEVIVFSFGSFMKVVNENQMELYLQAFKKLPQRVVMKSESSLASAITNNTLALKWIPQNDLLGHPKTKLLIYHCGSNGVFEALYHAVPVICIPLWEDQFDIARRVVSKGIGIQLDLHTLTSEKLVDSIRHVLDNPKYQENVNKLSSIFRDEPQTPIERVTYWMEFVVRHDGVPHLRSAAHDLNILQYYLVDVIAVIIILCFLVLYMAYEIFKWTFGKICAETEFDDNMKRVKSD